MSENKPSTAPASAAAQQISPQAEIENRITALAAQVNQVTGELKIIEGRMANRDPKILPTLQQENEILKYRISRLELAITALLDYSLPALTVDDMKYEYEILRSSAVEYFKKNNIDTELWKNIVS